MIIKRAKPAEKGQDHCYREDLVSFCPLCRPRSPSLQPRDVTSLRQNFYHKAASLISMREACGVRGMAMKGRNVSMRGRVLSAFSWVVARLMFLSPRWHLDQTTVSWRLFLSSSSVFGCDFSLALFFSLLFFFLRQAHHCGAFIQKSFIHHYSIALAHSFTHFFFFFFFFWNEPNNTVI